MYSHCMKLLEYMGKELFKKYGIDIPKGEIVEHGKELKRINIPFPWVMKSQVLVGGRGKAGGIKFADNLDEAEKIFDELIKPFSSSAIFHMRAPQQITIKYL